MKIIITENQLKRLIIESDNRSDGTKLIASQNFWDWLRWHEGSPIKKGEPILKAYKDTVDVWTIGYGHTGEEAYQRNVISKSKANELFIKDVNEAAKCVKRFLNSWKEKNHEGYKLKLNEYEALISLVINSGCEGVRTSDFIQKLKKGNYDDAAELIKTYRSKGLKNRRNVEYELFKNSQYIKD
jgi:lysozyme